MEARWKRLCTQPFDRATQRVAASKSLPGVLVGRVDRSEVAIEEELNLDRASPLRVPSKDVPV
jgi:hypothetical protein